MIEDIITRLSAGETPFKRVEELEELSRLASQPTIAVPCAFVIEEAFTATDFQSGSNILEQIISTTAAVIIVAGADGARRGAGNMRLRELEAFVVDRLFAAEIPGLARPLALVGGQLLSILPGRVTAIVRFRGESRRRVTRV